MSYHYRNSFEALPKYFCAIVPNCSQTRFLRQLFNTFLNIIQSQWTSTCVNSHQIVRFTGTNGYAKGNVLLALWRPCIKPTPPASANLPCLTGSSAHGGVLNSFVLPVHSWVPRMLLCGVKAPWTNSLRLPALYLLLLHSCSLAPLKWRTIPRLRYFFVRLLPTPDGWCLSVVSADHNPHHA